MAAFIQTFNILEMLPVTLPEQYLLGMKPFLKKRVLHKQRSLGRLQPFRKNLFGTLISKSVSLTSFSFAVHYSSNLFSQVQSRYEELKVL